MSKYRVFSSLYFPVFGLNTEKYGLEKTPYLDTFHEVGFSNIHFLKVSLIFLFLTGSIPFSFFNWLPTNLFLWNKESSSKSPRIFALFLLLVLTFHRITKKRRTNKILVRTLMLVHDRLRGQPVSIHQTNFQLITTEICKTKMVFIGNFSFSHCAKNVVFHYRFLPQIWTNPQFPVDLVIFPSRHKT